MAPCHAESYKACRFNTTSDAMLKRSEFQDMARRAQYGFIKEYS